MVLRTRKLYDKLTVAELVNIFLIDSMFISVFATYTVVQRAPCSGNRGIK